MPSASPTSRSPGSRRLARMRNRHFLALDTLCLCLTPSAALWIRLEGRESLGAYASPLVAYTVCALFVRLAIFRPFGLYSRYWRYATVEEILTVVAAALVSGGVIAFLFLACFDVGTYLPRSVTLVDSLLVLLAVGGSRCVARLGQQGPGSPEVDGARRVLVIGAASAGQMIVREMQAHPEMGLRPVGFLDDDPGTQYLRILGLPVLGGQEALTPVLSARRIQQVVIAAPEAGGRMVRRVVAACEDAGVPVKTVPPVSAILQGRVAIGQLRPVQIEDVLRREPVRTDIAAVGRLLRGRRVLVTGGGGSIGGEVCRQVLACDPAEIVILGHGENSVFDAHNELDALLRRRARGSSTPAGAAGLPTALRPVIADIRSAGRIRGVMEAFRPQVVFHCAAHKHVPLMELNPAEAITNNVLGTRNVLDAALGAGVERFVMVSTDKAVNPSSVMGASKRAAELLVLRAAQQSGRPYVVVRFGNVLGSRGSVVPLFRRQIAEGGPVTVSHPDMTRYFMTIPEAVQLMLQAAVMGEGGEVFMLDMGEPVRIVDLARDLIELSGLEVGRDIDIVYTDIRPGEKLFEELLVRGEAYRPTTHEKIRVACSDGWRAPEDLDAALEALRVAASGERSDVLYALRRVVPGFQPDEDRGRGPGTPAPSDRRPVEAGCGAAARARGV